MVRRGQPARFRKSNPGGFRKVGSVGSVFWLSLQQECRHAGSPGFWETRGVVEGRYFRVLESKSCWDVAAILELVVSEAMLRVNAVFRYVRPIRIGADSRVGPEGSACGS